MPLPFETRPGYPGTAETGLPLGRVVFGPETPQMTTDELTRRLAAREAVIDANFDKLVEAYRQHEAVEAALKFAVAELEGVADSEELAEDLLELEELAARIWDHLFVGEPTRDDNDRIEMSVR